MSDTTLESALSFISDIIPKYPDITDIHTIGSRVVVQTVKGLFQLGYEAEASLAARLLKEHGVDFSATAASRRIRVHISKTVGEQCDLSIRVHPETIRSLEECDAESALLDLTKLRAGLIVVAGHTGSRKTTLVGGMIDRINTNRDALIITVEDPVELVHSPKKGIVRHKEIGPFLTWSEALRDLYRENADVIVIGETRDYDAINAALDLALSGKLVLTTIHASNVEDTIRQFVGRAPADKAAIVANNLADALAAVIVQRMTLGRQFQREYMVLRQQDRDTVRNPQRFKEIKQNLDNFSRTNTPGYKMFPEERT